MRKVVLISLLFASSFLAVAQSSTTVEQTITTQVSHQVERQSKDVAQSRLPHRLSLYCSDQLWGFQTSLAVKNIADADIYGAMVTLGRFAINLDYQYVSKSQRWSYGLDVGYSYLNTKPKGSSNPAYSANFVSVMPMVTCYYIKKGIVRLYGSVSVGVLALIDHDQSYARFAFQINPIGIRVGTSRIAGFFALGIGSQGVCNLGLQVGI